ncbi:cardiolipin synthase [Sphingobacterium hungaricum]|uniref:Cardiolipin synthase n=1 Tax=Sphingobacterium hungaricum TaxID=2082723 RepID=A0A928V023_9SPHI|nr:cardiolipin synthase [Sphingobacterium hungaricum]MBE8714605.1 cardiolipin synthase [Sphingobacterium hungaricum]
MEIVRNIIEFLGHWYWIPVILLYLGVIVTILAENGNPTKAMAWILVIVFLPIIGLVLYYLFGQEFTRIKKLKKINLQEEKRLEKEWVKLDAQMNNNINLLYSDIGDLSRVYTFLKNERLSSPSLNNELKLLVNGEEKFKYFLEALESAKHHIHLEYYIFEPDNIGLKVLNILERKACEGLHVRLIVDSFGSPKLVGYMERMIKKGKSKIEFYAFLPVTFSSLANSNYRNHRKIAVVDAKIGFIGGINISDRYINSASSDGYWRDTSVMVKGDSINMMQVNFWNSWNMTECEPFDLRDGYLAETSKDIQNKSAVAYVPSNPGSLGPFNLEAMLIALGEANKKIQLTTPYFIPPDQLSSALKVAAASGVEVELLMPKKGDSFLVQHASFSYINEMLKRGVKVYLYTKGFVHAKTVSIDNQLSFIGTVNLDTRSFHINFEINAVISDEQLSQDMEKQFEIDKSNAHLVTLKEWENRKRWKKGFDSICRLLAPLL